MGSDRYAVGKKARYQQLASTLWTERTSFDSHWREIGELLMPRRLRFLTSDRNKGDKRNQKIIDSTGRYAARTLQSGLHAGLTSPARPWFILSTPDPSLNRRPNVKIWLHEVTERMRAIFQQVNLYNSLPIVYGDMGMFGTAAMGVLDDSRDLFRTYTYPIGSYALGVSARGLVTTFYREYETTVRQLVEDFGVQRGYKDIDWSNISHRVKEAWDKGDYESPVTVCWLVLPNEDADANKIESKYLPWASCHWEQGGTESPTGFLRERGYRTFPFMCPRWDVTSHEDAYGSDCPGMTALGDIKQLQSEQKKKGQAINKIVDPPLVGSSQLRSQKVSLLPADITYEDVAHGQQGLRPVHEMRIDLSHLTADIGEVQYRIQRAFHEDLFLMLANDRRQQPATAREIDERHEEKLLALGPVLERTSDELLDPLVDRAYGMMEQAEMIPEPPEELNGVQLKVEYISILAQAQKLVGVVSQDRFLNSVAAMAQTFPNARHKVSEFHAVNNYGDMLGVDPNIILSDEEAQQAVDAEAKAQQAALDAENAQKLALAGKAAAQSPMDGDTALTRLANNFGAGGFGATQ
jgi:hypothetical protein